MVTAATVRFLNVTASISGRDAWQDTSRGKLWLYNLHYFDDLTARDADQRQPWHDVVVARWIRENPPAAGSGWESYPTSLRIANWIKWLLSSGTAAASASAAIDSLAVQARWLIRRLEFHILGNHLWSNAKALLMAGLFFEGPEAEAWRMKGLQILSAELDEQILADGGHFERSPMYHAIILEDVLDLIQMDRVYPQAIPREFKANLHSTSKRMLRWLRVMTHPDGEISFFNDAAFGIAARYDVLAAYARTNGVDFDQQSLGPVEWLRDSGYVRLTIGRAILMCDVAPVGPDYQPGHAHADTLSFELSLDGRRVIVNGGTSTYTPGPQRAQQRATAAHSTVEVDGLDSSEVWGGFRVARRARPFDVDSGETAERVWARGSHDGYRRLHGRVVHRREWTLDSDSLSVTDTLEGQYRRAVARFILHPNTAPDRLDVSSEPQVSIARVPASWHPEFGTVIDTSAITLTLSAARTTTHLRWR
jgi:uncharacterized heparinase superfamily protein